MDVSVAYVLTHNVIFGWSIIPVFLRPFRPIQPGHPSVCRCNEYWRWCHHLWGKNGEFSVALGLATGPLACKIMSDFNLSQPSSHHQIVRLLNWVLPSPTHIRGMSFLPTDLSLSVNLLLCKTYCIPVVDLFGFVSPCLFCCAIGHAVLQCCVV